MAITNTNHALVNRSNTYIPIYNKLVQSQAHTGNVTAGGDLIGRVYPNEFYVVLKNSSSNVTSFKILFRDGDGKQMAGYIETSPGVTMDDYAWVKYQEPYHYYNSNGSALVSAAKETIDGKSYRVFTVVGSSRNCKDRDGNNVYMLPEGTRLATSASTTGQSHMSYMIFYKKILPTQASWNDLIPGEGYGFVDLGISIGTMPDSRPIR